MNTKTQLSETLRKASGKLVASVRPSQKSEEKTLNKLNSLSPNNQAVAQAIGEGKITNQDIEKARFLSSHLLLDPDSVLVDMGCENGAITYALALLHPQWKIIGVEIDKDLVNIAKKTYKADNLSFKTANIGHKIFDDNSVDAIINSFVLHEIYSNSSFNTRQVTKTLEAQYAALRPNGLILIRDYAMPTLGEYVLMEFSDNQYSGDTIETMSEVDLLMYYSEQARSGASLSLGGFFLEELPPRHPGTRLFRLPYKWAYEFIMRKDSRSKLLKELPKEYTFNTQRDFRRDLRGLGARVVYSAPHYNDEIITNTMEGKFRLYNEDGTSLEYPPTSLVIVAQKITNDASVRLQEWRQSHTKKTGLTITTMREKSSGRTMEIVSKAQKDRVDFIPYRVHSNGRLKVILHEGMPRGLMNLVPRNGKNIDRKYWSGHMIEAMAFEREGFDEKLLESTRSLNQYLSKQIGVEVSQSIEIEKGMTLYPDPGKIDEAIFTYSIRLYPEMHDGKVLYPQDYKYQPIGLPNVRQWGRLREFDAEDILSGIEIGFIPNALLELQIYDLFQKLKIKPQGSGRIPPSIATYQPKHELDMKAYMQELSKQTKNFSKDRKPARHTRAMQSVFLEEGKSDEGGMIGLSSEPLDFFLEDDKSPNLAVVLPLAKNIKGDLMAGLIEETLPVPERVSGQGKVMDMPSFYLPSNISTMEEARLAVAEKFGVDVKFVKKLKESYYLHASMTPTRVFPFMITNTKKMDPYWHRALTTFANLREVHNIIYTYGKKGKVNMISTIKEAYELFHTNVDWGYQREKAPRQDMATRVANADILSVETDYFSEASSSSSSTSGEAGSGSGSSGDDSAALKSVEDTDFDQEEDKAKYKNQPSIHTPS